MRVERDDGVLCVLCICITRETSETVGWVLLKILRRDKNGGGEVVTNGMIEKACNDDVYYYICRRPKLKGLLLLLLMMMMMSFDGEIWAFVRRSGIGHDSRGTHGHSLH